MDVMKTALEGVVLLKPKRFRDDRGFFSETWNRHRLQAAGLSFDFVQDNHSFSARAGTVRGLHYQAPPSQQAKLVRVSRGAIRDVAVDIRRGSPTFGQWVAEDLSAENGLQLMIPTGFLHGFITLCPETEVIYKVDRHYDPECDGAVRFDDPDLKIDWGRPTDQIILSGKDALATEFRDFQSPFEWRHPVPAE